MKEEMRPIIRLRQPSLMIPMWCSFWTQDLLNSSGDQSPGPPQPPGPPDSPPRWPPAPSPAETRERVGLRSPSCERVPLRPSQSESQLIPIPVNDSDDYQPSQEERSRERSRSRERTYSHVQTPQVSQVQPMDTPESNEISDEEFSDMNHSSPLAEPQQSGEQRGRSRSDERSRERTSPRSSPQDLDESSAIVDPQNRVIWSFKNTSRTRRLTKKWSTTTATWFITANRRENCCWKAIEWNTRGHEAQVHWQQDERWWRASKWTWILFNYRYLIGPVLPYAILVVKTGNTTRNTVHKVGTLEGQCSTQIFMYMTNDEHWTVTPETHKCAAAAGSFCFVNHWRWRTAGYLPAGHYADVCKRSLSSWWSDQWLQHIIHKSTFLMESMVTSQTRDMLEHCITTCGKPARSRVKMRSRTRKEASAQEVRGHYKQFNEAKHPWEQSPGLITRFFYLIGLRKVRPRKLCLLDDGYLTINTDKQDNFLKSKKPDGVPRGFQDKQKEYLQTDSPVFHKTWISDELPNDSQQQDCESFSAFISKQSFLTSDNLMMWTVMLCINYHQKQVIHHTLLQDWRNLRTTWIDAPSTLVEYPWQGTV